MIRDIEDTGEIFEPKTVKSSFSINCDSTFAYLFGIDLKRRDFIWLNANRDSSAHIAGESQFGFLINYFKLTDIINLGSLLEMMATEKVNSPEEADVIVSDEDLDLADGKIITALIK